MIENETIAVSIGRASVVDLISLMRHVTDRYELFETLRAGLIDEYAEQQLKTTRKRFYLFGKQVPKWKSAEQYLSKNLNMWGDMNEGMADYVYKGLDTRFDTEYLTDWYTFQYKHKMESINHKLEFVLGQRFTHDDRVHLSNDEIKAINYWTKIRKAVH